MTLLLSEYAEASVWGVECLASSPMPDASTDYAILEVRQNASWDEIQRAYLDLVRVWHPDRFASDRRLQERARQKLQQIDESYRRLEAQRARSVDPSVSASPGARTHPPAAGSQTNFWNLGPPWIGSIALPVLAGVCAIVGWLGVMHYLSLPSRASRATNFSGALNAAPAALFSEKTIELTAVPGPVGKERLRESGEQMLSRMPRLPVARPESGEALIEPEGPKGHGTIEIRNQHSADIVADIRQRDGGTNARSVYVRSGEEAVISGLGLGLYQAWFHTVSGRDALRRQSHEYYRLDDAMRFYEVRMAGETQSVRYIVTVP